MNQLVFNNETIHFLSHPDYCPHCHNNVSPIVKANNRRNYKQKTIDLFLLCTNRSCLEAFIGTYQPTYSKENFYKLVKVSKGNLKLPTISDTIKSTSPDFFKIYSEAYIAEQEGLLNICGIGYRKALEFLIKDYLILESPSDTDVIKKKFLGKCIDEHVDNPKLKSAAIKAVWYGNDEAHYTRKWINKDLNDLKKLIELTRHWIEMEILSKDIENED